MKTIGIIPRIKLISLWNNVKRNGLYWTKSPSKNSYIERIKAYGKKSKFYTLLKPEIVLIMDPGKYDVKIYTLKKINCMSWSVSCKRYISIYYYPYIIYITYIICDKYTYHI